MRLEFPRLVSYQRFVTISQDIKEDLYHLILIIPKFLTGNYIVDSTHIKVCHNKRIYSHSIFKNLAARGKSTMGWFFGFKLHIVIPLGRPLNQVFSQSLCHPLVLCGTLLCLCSNFKHTTKLMQWRTLSLSLICSLFLIADGTCGQSDLDCAYTKYAMAAVKALQDGKCADQGYTVKTGTQTKTYPVIGDIVITTYTHAVVSVWSDLLEFCVGAFCWFPEVSLYLFVCSFGIVLFCRQAMGQSLLFGRRA